MRFKDVISTFDDLNGNHGPAEFISGKNHDCVIYQFPKIVLSIKIDKEFQMFSYSALAAWLLFPLGLFKGKMLN